MAGNKKAKDAEVIKRSIVNQALSALANDSTTTIKKQAERLGVTRGALYGWMLSYEGEKYKAIIAALPHIIAGETIDIADGEPLEIKRDENGNACKDEKGNNILVAMPPARARNAINARQFIQERRFHSSYGRKDQLEVSGTVDVVARLHAARKRLADSADEVESDVK